MFETLMEQGAVKRRGRGRPRLRSNRVVADKGYSARGIRAYARGRGIRITTPRSSSERGLCSISLHAACAQQRIQAKEY